MASDRILIIEDDPDIVELIQYNVAREGYLVSFALDGQAGVTLAKRERPDLIVLDLMLPRMHGLDVCRALRADETTREIPIIILTAKEEESDIVAGLELGADDYVTKPFSPRELVARIRAVLRRTRRAAQSPKAACMTHGAVSIDHDRHEAVVSGTTLTLTLTEFRLLSALISAPGRVFTRDQLLDRVTGGDVIIIDRNIDVHIRAIRKKLGALADMIQTVRGVGYKCKD